MEYGEEHLANLAPEGEVYMRGSLVIYVRGGVVVTIQASALLR